MFGLRTSDSQMLMQHDWMQQSQKTTRTVKTAEYLAKNEPGVANHTHVESSASSDKVLALQNLQQLLKWNKR